MTKTRSIFGPLVLIATGILWLLIQTNRLPISNLWVLTRIWPFLLISAGISLVLQPYWKYVTILIDVITVSGAVLAILFAPSFGWDQPSLFYFSGDGGNLFTPGESGSGKVISQTREVPGFSGVELDYPAQVTVRQGQSVSVKIEAEDNLMPGLKTQVQGGVLQIFYKAENGKHVNPTKAVKISIVVKDLNEIDFESAGELHIEAIEADNLKVSVSGAGSLDLKDIKANHLSVNLSGAGPMTASGTADDFILNISGFGSFNGKDLQNKTADINISGAGSATAWVDNHLDAKISGAGSINYYGSPDVSKQIGGIGTVSKAGNK